MPGTSERPWLLNPGPCNVSEDVRAAANTPDICHREKDYLEVQTEVRQLLMDAYDCDPKVWTSAMITGSGTAALEMAISSCVSASGAMLVIENGVYGERIRSMCDAHDIEAFSVTGAWTERPDLNAVEETLRANPSIEVVAMVHHETTTGLINPVDDVAAIAKRHGKRLVLDTISGLGGEALNLANVDIAVCTANKLAQGLPGVSFCLVRRDFSEDLKGYPSRSLYLNLANYIAKQETGGTPFTPAVQITYAFRQALRELRDEGLANRVGRMAAASETLRAGFRRLGLKPYIDESLHSNTITTLLLPEGVTYPVIHDRMRERGFVVYAGQGDLSKRVFRIANMGLLPPEALDGVITALEESIR
jgi:2-aminoethylphosphonate-pyruvate transaminase